MPFSSLVFRRFGAMVRKLYCYANRFTCFIKFVCQMHYLYSMAILPTTVMFHLDRILKLIAWFLYLGALIAPLIYLTLQDVIVYFEKNSSPPQVIFIPLVWLGCPHPIVLSTSVCCFTSPLLLHLNNVQEFSFVLILCLRLPFGITCTGTSLILFIFYLY